KEQLSLLMKSHNVPIVVSESSTPIPLHFAFGEGAHVEASTNAFIDVPMRDIFDTPDLNTTYDEIANGEGSPGGGIYSPLA
ncbi:AMP nucleosidase, partial [Rhizobium leguminosarum]